MNESPANALAALTDAVETLHEVVASVEEAQLALPTPCDEFDVRRLMEHVIGWQRVTAACASGVAPPFVGGSPTYRLGVSAEGELRQASTELLGALARSLESIDLPYRGPTARRTILDELVAETVIHTWDLAQAIRWTVSFDAHTVDVAHTGLTALLGESFASMGFRASSVDSAPPRSFDRLIARSGRALDLN